MAGDVVFLCGTGISAPQLPDFKSLVDRTFVALGVALTPSETKAYEGQRFEEVLGSLSRRLAEPERMVRAASALLATPDHPMLEQHVTVLRLSRDLNNRILTVTTNFDTLLEQAVPLVAPQVASDSISYAGQALPAPGSPDFTGIIHLHGRLAAPLLDLEATPLVLTSSDYGDAYMRSGWASRFLFDLARCKTIVLVGYSANDAPVRYFLNVLEADRTRFPDLRQVYAFDAYEHDPAEAEASWGTVAVTPLVYCKVNPETGGHDHSPLWNDLRQLADLLDRPKRSREERARAILGRDVATPDDRDLQELRWLFLGRGDLWPAALDTITNAQWFSVFQDNKLWTSEEAARVLPAWIAQRFEDADRLKVAAEWAPILGQFYVEKLGQFYRQHPSETPLWNRAWRLFLTSRTWQSEQASDRAYVLKQRLESALVLDADLEQAVDLLRPVLSIRSQQQLLAALADDGIAEQAGNEAPRRLSDLVWIEFEVGDPHAAGEIVSALGALADRPARILELATEALRSAVAEAVDLGMIEGDYDTTDLSVPSIEEHEQNENHDGVIFLLRVAVNAFGKTVAVDRPLARAIVQRLLLIPGRAGVRLGLHAMRNPGAFSSDEAMDTLLALSVSNFWNIRREIAMLLRDRIVDADPAKRALVEARIRDSGDDYYARYPIEADQVDWRADARDSAVWLRLTMLEQAGSLSPNGAAELAAIKARRDHLDRNVEERDFFGSYSYGVTRVIGDVAPIEEADPDARLQVANELARSPDMERQLGWRSFCSSNPQGAFETLEDAPLSEPNLALWDDLFAALSFGDEGSAPLRSDLIVRSFARLAGLEAIPRKLAAGMCNALMQGPRRLIVDLEGWFDRLWAALSGEDREIDFGKDLYSTAINTAAGRLSQSQVQEIDHSRKEGGPDLARQIARLRTMVEQDGASGIVARAICVHDLAYLLVVDASLVTDFLVPQLNGDIPESRAQRRILVEFTSISPDVSKLLPEAIIRAVTETSPDARAAQQIASRILRPALASVRGDNPERWGLSEADIARALRGAPAKVRRGALNVLVRWLHGDEAGAEQAWTIMVGPFFEKVWPKERRFVDETNNGDLFALAVGAGAHFPEAFDALKPYIAPYVSVRGNLHAIVQSQAPETFPHVLLALLWRAFSQAGATNYQLAEVLDRLLKVDPTLEIDRRFQALEQRAVRFS